MAVSGDRLADRYVLVEPIGAGGMATVWRAYDTRLQRAVAVKLLRPQFAEDPEFVRRFESEARHAASLAHPNVATVFDTGEAGGEPYIVMELADGPTVADLLRDRGPLPPPLAVEVAAAAARALAAAHRRGLVHRDVKPANLLLARDGTVRLADFGIARALTTSRITVPGTVLGSIPYLSPEQARGEEATAAGDIFSLGVVLFEMLTGRLPWSADSPAALATVRLTAPPTPPSAVKADLPEGLDAVVARALDLDPAVRYPSARAFAETLETWLRRFAETAPKPAPDLADTIALVATGGTVAANVTDAPDVAGSDLHDDARIVASAEARPNAPPLVALPPAAPADRPPTHRYAPALPPAPTVPERRVQRDHGALVATASLAVMALLVAVGLGALVANEPRGGVLGATATPGLDASGGAAASPSSAIVLVAPTATPTPSPVLTLSPIVEPSPVPTPTLAPDPAPTASPAPAPSRTPRPRATTAPTPAPTPRPARPAADTAASRAVAEFYGAVESHDWERAIDLWSPSMQERYPPDDWLIGRFRRTTDIDITRLDTVAIDRDAGRARVAVSLIEYRAVEPSPQQFTGAWDLVRIDGAWRLDDPDF